MGSNLTETIAGINDASKVNSIETANIMIMFNGNISTGKTLMKYIFPGIFTMLKYFWINKRITPTPQPIDAPLIANLKP